MRRLRRIKRPRRARAANQAIAHELINRASDLMARARTDRSSESERLASVSRRKVVSSIHGTGRVHLISAFSSVLEPRSVSTGSPPPMSRRKVPASVKSPG
jgi:hypothetical protein